MAIVRPAKLVLCADQVTLQDERREGGRGRCARCTRGYTQAQLEPDEAVAAMDRAGAGSRPDRLSTELDDGRADLDGGRAVLRRARRRAGPRPDSRADARKQ